MKLTQLPNLVYHSTINLEKFINDYKILVEEGINKNNKNNLPYDSAQQYAAKSIIEKYNLKCCYKTLQEENKLQGCCEKCLGIDNCEDYKR